MKLKKAFFLLIRAGCILLSGCGQKEETQEKGELVMTGSSFLCDILNLKDDFVMMLTDMKIFTIQEEISKISSGEDYEKIIDLSERIL